MAKVKCKFCGKKIEEGLKKCPKCKKRLVEGVGKSKILLFFLWVVIQFLLVYLLFEFGKSSLYSSQLSDLYVLILFIVLLILNSIIVIWNIYKSNKRNALVISAGLLSCAFLIYSFVYMINVGKAFVFENSQELLMLSKTYEFSTAKQIKNEIDKVFEKDNNNVFSRDVIIDSFYTDGDISNLYLNDSYGNYKLKFYLDMDDFIIQDVYCVLDDYKLYLVKDKEKTENFEFYYAMNVLDNVLGEDIKGLARIDSVVEEEVGKEFSISANAIFNYEVLEYHSSNNTFSLDGDVYNMNYYGDMSEKEFTIIFNNNYESSNRRVWYYGDSSFDYVNWKINM